MDNILELETKHRLELRKTYNEPAILDIAPKSWLEAQLKSVNQCLEEELQFQRKTRNSGYEPWIEEEIIQASEDRKKKLNSYRKRLLYRMHPQDRLNAGEITDADIARAKLVPIGDILGIQKNGNIRCIWHDDSTPSAKWYKQSNILKCFSCGKFGDPIDVVQKLYNLSFIEAVRRLL